MRLSLLILICAALGACGDRATGNPDTEGKGNDLPAEVASASQFTYELALNKNSEEGSQYYDHVREVFGHSEYAQWEAAASAVLSDEEYFLNGQSRSGLFFQAVFAVHGTGKPKDMRFLQRLEEWRKLYPDSAGEKLVRLPALIAKAWNYRGGDYTYTVTDVGWQGFHEYINQAEALAQELIEEGVTHPQVYACMIEVSMCKGYDKPTAIKWFRKGLNEAPFYLPLYAKTAMYFTKQWYGVPEDYQIVIDNAIEETRSKTGMAAGYLMFYSFLMYHTRLFEIVKHVKWETLKPGFEDYVHFFGENTNDLNHICRTACAYQQKEDAQVYFTRIGDRFNGYVWRRAMFDAWKKWALSGGELPVSHIIHEAAEANNIQKVQEELDAGVDVDLLDQMGRTVIMCALHGSDFGLIRLLLDYGADPNTRIDGHPLIHLATVANDTEMIKLLLSMGVDPNTHAGAGWTPLHSAVRDGLIEALDLLLEHPNIDIEFSNEKTSTPLSTAARYGQLDAVKVLIEHGADPNRETTIFDPPLLYAVAQKKTAIARYLLEQGANPGQTRFQGWTALTAAVDTNNPELVDLLLQHKADVNQADFDGWTAMHMAAMNGNLPLLQRLLDEPGANMSVATKEGRTLLHQAVKSDHLEVLKFLLERGLPLNATNKKGQTALDFARELGRKEMESYLVSIGAPAKK